MTIPPGTAIAKGGEQDVFDARGGRVCGLGVHPLPRFVELAEVASRFASGRSEPRTRFHAVSTPTSRYTVNARARSRSRLSGESTAPPPSAMTASGPASTSASVSSSIRAELRLARASKSSGIGPWRFSISPSRSTNGRAVSSATRAPTVDFPAPMNPEMREVAA